jgi:LAS superfamily LD-carboxypeptidase LdcB
VTPAELTGRARSHIVALADAAGSLHQHVVTPFRGLKRAAASAGFRLEAVSSFRDFDRQLLIWNRKFNGELPLYDATGLRLDTFKLSPGERVTAILLWSALPGASRHHWGTDFDLIDAGTPPGRQAALVAAEFAPGGPFAALSAWLAEHAAHFGFFRPFRGKRSGVQAEPWHYSFAPVAERARRQLTCEVLAEALEEAPLAGKSVVLSQLVELHARYVAAIDWP